MKMGFQDVLLGVVLIVIGILIFLYGLQGYMWAPLSGGGLNDIIPLGLMILGAAVAVYGRNKTRG